MNILTVIQQNPTAAFLLVAGSIYFINSLLAKFKLSALKDKLLSPKEEEPIKTQEEKTELVRLVEDTEPSLLNEADLRKYKLVAFEISSAEERMSFMLEAMLHDACTQPSAKRDSMNLLIDQMKALIGPSPKEVTDESVE